MKFVSCVVSQRQVNGMWIKMVDATIAVLMVHSGVVGRLSYR